MSKHVKSIYSQPLLCDFFPYITITLWFIGRWLRFAPILKVLTPSFASLGLQNKGNVWSMSKRVSSTSLWFIVWLLPHQKYLYCDDLSGVDTFYPRSCSLTPPKTKKICGICQNVYPSCLPKPLCVFWPINKIYIMIIQEMGTLRPRLTPNFTPLHPHIQGIFLVLLLKFIPNYSKYFILQWLVCWFGFKLDQMLLFEEIWQKGLFFSQNVPFSGPNTSIGGPIHKDIIQLM